MQQWLLSVAGIAILSVLCDVILPQGQTKKYIKTVIGVVVTLTVVQPIFLFFNTYGDVSTQETSQNEILPQQQYLSYTEAISSDDAVNLALALKTAGFSDAIVTFDTETQHFVVKLNASYSAELYALAQSATLSANVNYPVNYIWL